MSQAVQIRAALAAVTAASTLLFSSCGTSGTQSRSSVVRASDTPVIAAVAMHKLHRVVRSTGTIQPVQAYSIPVPQLSEGGNLILTKIAQTGTTVKPGDIVAEFDRTTYLDKARDAQARFEDLEHQVEQKKAQIRSDAEKRSSELQQAEADEAKARLELRKGPLLSEIDRLKAETKQKDAADHVASLKRSSALRDQAAAADLRVLELQRDRQRVTMERAKDNADRLQLRAPLAGMVAQEVVWRGSGGPGHPQEGDQLWPGQPLVRIFSSSQMEVDVSVGEPDRLIMVPGTKAKVRVDAFPDVAFNAVFDSASPAAVSSPESIIRTFTGRFLLEGNDPRLLPDASASLDVDTTMANPVLAVPRGAIVIRGRQAYVHRVSGEKTQDTPVTVGVVDEAFAEVVSGLKAGDQVMVASSRGI